MRCIIACLAVCAAMRPKSFGVTGTSSSSPSWTSALNFFASSKRNLVVLVGTFSTTVSLAYAFISPDFGSISTRKSFAGPTALRAAWTRAGERRGAGARRVLRPRAASPRAGSGAGARAPRCPGAPRAARCRRCSRQRTTHAHTNQGVPGRAIRLTTSPSASRLVPSARVAAMRTPVTRPRSSRLDVATPVGQRDGLASVELEAGQHLGAAAARRVARRQVKAAIGRRRAVAVGQVGPLAALAAWRPGAVAHLDAVDLEPLAVQPRARRSRARTGRGGRARPARRPTSCGGCRARKVASRRIWSPSS